MIFCCIIHSKEQHLFPCGHAQLFKNEKKSISTILHHLLAVNYTAGISQWIPDIQHQPLLLF
jgi:hypothetical protein